MNSVHLIISSNNRISLPNEMIHGKLVERSPGYLTPLVRPHSETQYSRSNSPKDPVHKTYNSNLHFFQPTQLSQMHLKYRIVVAPLTRLRPTANIIYNERIYYTQRLDTTVLL